MKRMFAGLCCLFLYLPLAAGQTKELKTLLAQSADELQSQAAAVAGLPPDLLTPQGAYTFVLSSQNKGAAAEYDARKDKIFVFARPLAQWLNRMRDKYDAVHLPGALARCLAPVYIHELSHARDARRGRENGFVWPVTLEDEYTASFWQLYFIQARLPSDPDYYPDCREFLPPRAWTQAPPEQWEQLIYARYASVARAASLPPPLRAEFIAALAQNREILFEGAVFKPTRRKISLQLFFKRGGSWLQIKAADLPKITDHPSYLIYESILNANRLEMRRAWAQQNACFKAQNNID